jgi:hypothetical protein
MYSKSYFIVMYVLVPKHCDTIFSVSNELKNNAVAISKCTYSPSSGDRFKDRKRFFFKKF